MSHEVSLDSSLTTLGWLGGLQHASENASAAPGRDGATSAASAVSNDATERDCAGHSTESCAGDARELVDFEEVSQNQKPPHSYNKLIRLSILNSPQRRRTLSQIYKWIEDKFPFYKTAGTSWKNSIRHNLSLKKWFKKVPRSREDPGRGYYWTIDDSNPNDDGDDAGLLPPERKQRKAKRSCRANSVLADSERARINPALISYCNAARSSVIHGSPVTNGSLSNAGSSIGSCGGTLFDVGQTTAGNSFCASSNGGGVVQSLKQDCLLAAAACTSGDVGGASGLHASHSSQGSSLPADFRLEESSSSSGGIGFNDSMLSSLYHSGFFNASQSFSNVDGLSRTQQAQIFSGPMFSSHPVPPVSCAAPGTMRQVFSLPVVTGGSVLPEQQTTQHATLVDMSQSLHNLPVSSLAVPSAVGSNLDDEGLKELLRNYQINPNTLAQSICVEPPSLPPPSHSAPTPPALANDMCSASTISSCDFAISRSTAHLIDQLFKEEPSNDAEVGGRHEPLVDNSEDDDDDNIWDMQHMLH